jgi:hypothetical protein
LRAAVYKQCAKEWRTFTGRTFDDEMRRRIADDNAEQRRAAETKILPALEAARRGARAGSAVLLTGALDTDIAREKQIAKQRRLQTSGRTRIVRAYRRGYLSPPIGANTPAETARQLAILSLLCGEWPLLRLDEENEVSTVIVAEERAIRQALRRHTDS